MKRSIWIANTKGGCGKTTLALFLASAWRSAGHELTLVDCDAKRKLRAFIGDEVRSLDIGASADDLRRDPQLAVSYWDELSEIIVASPADSLIDFGANVDRQVWNWARKSQVSEFFQENGVSLDIFVPITAEPLAVEGGIELLRETAATFPHSRRVLVLNQAAGTFESYAGSGLLQELSDMKEKGLLKIVIMPRCLSEGWLDFERLRLPFEKVIGMDAKEVADMTGLSSLKARRALGDLAGWLEEMYAGFSDLVPRQEERRASHREVDRLSKKNTNGGK